MTKQVNFEVKIRKSSENDHSDNSWTAKTDSQSTMILYYVTTVKLGDKERFDKEQIGVKKPFPVTNLPIYFIRIRDIWSEGTILG